MLAVPGALAGLVLVAVACPSRASTTGAAPRRLFLDMSVDWLVVTFAALAAFASALVVRIHSRRADVARRAGGVMKDDLSLAGRARGRLRMALVVAQVAVSLLLLIGAGLVPRRLEAARQPTRVSTPSTSSSLGSMSRRTVRQARGRGSSGGCWTRCAPTRHRVRDVATSPPLTMDDAERTVAIEGHAPRATKT